MEDLIPGLLAIAVLLVLAGLGIPVGISMILVAAGGIWIIVGDAFALSMLRTLPYATTSEYGFVIVPMFILMGAFCANAKITRDFFDAANRWLGNVRGGIYMATTIASAAFAAVSGSTVVNSTVFTRIALPEMNRLGYHTGVGAGVIASAGTIAGLIPPSLIMVVYGLLTGVSIGAMLIAGIVPGILTTFAYLFVIRIIVRVRPDLAPASNTFVPLREKISGLRGIWPIIPLVVLVLGGIYGGYFSPSSGGTIGAAGALILALARRRLSAGGFWDSISEAATLTTVVFIIIIGGLMMSRFLLVAGFVPKLNDFAIQVGVTPSTFLPLIILLYILLGVFMEALSMLVVTVPILFPIATSIGIDPIWFGVIVVKLAEIAVITPPVGINLYAVIGASGGRIGSKDIFLGVLPFVAIDLIVLGLLVIFPELSLWLPQTIRN